MERELDPEIIKATQNYLGKYVKRPPLSEKLLKKPPFRFLHDVVTSVLKTTGFFEGLFDDTELISENVKDRESKIAFLNKAITVLATTTGKSLSVKPSKIVAGQEADKTNELLQCLAYALDNKLTSHDAVKKFKEVSDSNTSDKTDKPKDTAKSVKKANGDKKLVSKSSDKLISQKKESSNKNDKSNTNVSKTKIAKPDKKDTNINKKESPPKQSIKKVDSKKKVLEKTLQKGDSLEPLESRDKINKEKKDEKVKEKVTDPVENVDENLSQQNYSETTKKEDNLVEGNVHVDSQLQELSVVDNVLESTLSSQDLMEVDNKIVNRDLINPETNNEITNEKENIASSPSKHQGDENQLIEKKNSIDEYQQNTTETNHEITDKLINNKTELLLDHNAKHSNIDTRKSKSPEKTNNPTTTARPMSVRPSSSRPGAPRFRDKHENIVGTSDNLIVGKVNIIQENTSIDEEEDNSIIIVEAKTNEAQEETIPISTNQHGHLVQQILDSTKEFSQTTGKTEIEWQFDTVKAREASSQETEQVRFNIQALSRVANPLGKLLDHIQEDVEVMRQELQQWSMTYEEASKELLKQKTANEESLFPLHTKIKHLNSDIEEKHDKINDLKVTIHKNAIRINKLLASGNVQ